MASFKEAAADKELPTQEDAEAVEQPYYSTAERRHVDALLDMSEEDFLKELEPHEYHCYSGWEEAVRGWARVAPLSCILLTQKKQRKLKPKEADNQTPFSVDLRLSNADSSASTAENGCESHAGPANSFKKSTFLKQQPGSLRDAALEALQLDAQERTAFNDVQKATSQPVSDEKTEEEKMLRENPVEYHNLFPKYSVSEYRPTKPQKHSHGPISTVVPIKNFTFFPRIESPYLNPKFVGQLCTGKMSSEGEAADENGFMFDKKSRTRGTRVESVAHAEHPNHSAGLTSKYRTCQHNLNLLSAVRVPVSKRYQVPMSPKPDAVHHTGYSMAKSLRPALHSSTEVDSQAYLHPSCLFS